MGIFTLYFQKIFELFQLEMNIYGFVFSFWDIFMWTLIAYLLISFISAFVPGK